MSRVGEIYFIIRFISTSEQAKSCIHVKKEMGSLVVGSCVEMSVTSFRPS